ncbi:hypothetical protein ACFFUE_02945 [Bergeyella porcorum]|uniref:hypothetical protein n=1 Tax=Bergeyella porcorum TaxID=1735111 RepID=UPI0035EF1247
MVGSTKIDRQTTMKPPTEHTLPTSEARFSRLGGGFSHQRRMQGEVKRWLGRSSEEEKV